MLKKATLHAIFNNIAIGDFFAQLNFNYKL